MTDQIGKLSATGRVVQAPFFAPSRCCRPNFQALRPNRLLRPGRFLSDPGLPRTASNWRFEAGRRFPGRIGLGKRPNTGKDAPFPSATQHGTQPLENEFPGACEGHRGYVSR